MTGLLLTSFVCVTFPYRSFEADRWLAVDKADGRVGICISTYPCSWPIIASVIKIAATAAPVSCAAAREPRPRDVGPERLRKGLQQLRTISILLLRLAEIDLSSLFFVVKTQLCIFFLVSPGRLCPSARQNCCGKFRAKGLGRPCIVGGAYEWLQNSFKSCFGVGGCRKICPLLGTNQQRCRDYVCHDNRTFVGNKAKGLDEFRSRPPPPPPHENTEHVLQFKVHSPNLSKINV